MPRATRNDHMGIMERLLDKPFREERVPSVERIRMIQQEVCNPRTGSRRRLLLTAAGAVMACIILIIALAGVYEMPGGLADRRISRAAGLEGTLRIPIGRTPEEAVQKIRHFPFMRVIHQEPVDGGALLFIKRYYQKEGTDLQVEYVRKMWLGWKWAMGGGYGIGGGMDKAALTYMGMPYKGIGSPFPLICGEVLDISVKKVMVIANGQNPSQYAAKVADTDTGGAIWFATLPLSAEAPYEIEALNGKGEIVARKTIDDLRDFGMISFSAANVKPSAVNPEFPVPGDAVLTKGAANNPNINKFAKYNWQQADELKSIPNRYLSEIEASGWKEKKSEQMGALRVFEKDGIVIWVTTHNGFFTLSELKKDK